MAEKRTRNPAAGVKAPGQEASENHYELDLDEHAPADIDEAFKDAVAAVDRSKEVASPDEAAIGRSSDDESPDRSQPSDASMAADSPAGPEGAAADAALRERLMRTLADFDNYRKRTEREKQTLKRLANFEVFKDFLGVLDNFERAMDSSGSAEDLKQGLKMIVRQHEEILRRHGVERVDSVGRPFDPTVHEAVAREESTEVEVPTVTKEMQKGYLLHDRLLRPAMVFVAMPAGRADAEVSADAGDE